VISIKARDKPSSPDPTIIADFGSADIFAIESLAIEAAFEDMRSCQSMNVRAMRREMEMSVRIFLRDIEAQKKGPQRHLCNCRNLVASCGGWGGTAVGICLWHEKIG
jgi:hypothetical protein